MPEISFKTAEIYSQFPARQKISWELGSQVPEENPALPSTNQHINNSTPAVLSLAQLSPSLLRSGQYFLWEPSSHETFLPCRKLGVNFCSFKGNFLHNESFLRKYLKEDQKALSPLGMDLWNQWKCLCTILHKPKILIK